MLLRKLEEFSFHVSIFYSSIIYVYRYGACYGHDNTMNTFMASTHGSYLCHVAYLGGPALGTTECIPTLEGKCLKPTSQRE